MFSHKYHGEVSAAYIRWNMVGAWGGSSTVSDVNAVGNDLYRDMKVNRGTVGGVATDIQSVCRVEGLRGGWTQEGGLVATRGDREPTLGNLVNIFTGSN